MTCPDVWSDPALTQSGTHSVPVVHPSGEMLDSDGFNGYILYYSDKKLARRECAAQEYDSIKDWRTQIVELHINIRCLGLLMEAFKEIIYTSMKTLISNHSRDLLEMTSGDSADVFSTVTEE